MSFIEHLEELRARLFRCAMAFIAATVVCWTFWKRLLAFISAPFVQAWRQQHLGTTPDLHFSGMDAWLASMQLALVGGLFLASPVVLYQLWRFVSPGLYARERRYVAPFVVFGTLFFVGGAAFCYRYVFPLAVNFFLSFGGEVSGSELHLRATNFLKDYLSFGMQMLVAFGIVFELPLVTTFLAMAGIVNYRQLWRFGRWFVVIASIIAAVLTPPDVGSMIMMLVPLLLLYLLSVGLAYLLGKRPPPEAATAK